MSEISDKKAALAETIASPSTILSAHTLCVSGHTLSFGGPYHPRLGPSKTTLSLQCHFILKMACFYTKDSPQKDWILLYNPGWPQSCDSSVLTSRCVHIWLCCGLVASVLKNLDSLRVRGSRGEAGMGGNKQLWRAPSPWQPSFPPPYPP